MNAHGDARTIVAATLVVGIGMLATLTYAGGGMIEQDALIHIAAPPGVVFPWLTEPEKLKRWLGGLVESSPLTGDGLRVGARSREVVIENGRRIEMESVVIRCEPDRALGARVQAGPFQSEVTYELSPVNGGTALYYRAAHHMSGVMRLMAPLFACAIRAKGERDLANLKREIEASS